MSEPTRKPELPPDLPEFIRNHGGYANVTPEGWREWERIKAEWQARNTTRPALLKIRIKTAAAEVLGSPLPEGSPLSRFGPGEALYSRLCVSSNLACLP
jgi:hypothetical protein